MNTVRVCAIVVTYNRKHLLEKCIKGILSGQAVPEWIIVVDNASTDNTREHVENLFQQEIRTGCLRYKGLSGNIGCSGGFHEGLKEALRLPADAFWLMDDDAEPNENTLFELLKQYDKNICLCSIPCDRSREKLSWPTVMFSDVRKEIVCQSMEDVPKKDMIPAPHLPFLGLILPKNIVSVVGFPNPKFFIWADDVEYTMRIRKQGFSLYYIRKSLILHPVVKTIVHPFLLRRNIILIDAPDWKHYYGLRNQVYMFSRSHQWRNVVNRIVFAMIVWWRHGANPKALRYYLKGIWHGITGNLGKYY